MRIFDDLISEKEVEDILKFNWNVIRDCRSEKEREEIIETGWRRINDVIKRTPKCGHAYLVRAHYQELFGKDQDALNDYNKAEEMETDDGFRVLILLNRRAQLKIKMKDYAGADSDLTSAIALSKIISGLISPSASELHIQRGLVRRLEKNSTDAMEDYQYAIRHGSRDEKDRATHYIRLLKIEMKLAPDDSIKLKDEKRVSDTSISRFDMQLRIWLVAIFFAVILGVIGIIIYVMWAVLTGNKLITIVW